MDNRFYVPGAGWDLLSKTLRNVKDGDNITDEYYAVVLDYIEVTIKQPKLRFYVRMIQPCNPAIKGTPHDFCINPYDADIDMFRYYSRQHTICEAPSGMKGDLDRGTIVQIKLNKKIYLNKTYVDTNTSQLLNIVDRETSNSMFPTLTTLIKEKDSKSIASTAQKNLTLATTNGGYSDPKDTRCFKIGEKDVLNGFMDDELLQTVEQYCQENNINDDYIAKKINGNGADIKLYKGVMQDYILFCEHFHKNITSQLPHIKLIVGEGYRPFDQQKKLNAEKPGLAKPAGESPHSWGLAIDIADADIDSKGSPLEKPSPDVLLDFDKRQSSRMFPKINDVSELTKEQIQSLIWSYNVENSFVVQTMNKNPGRFKNPFKDKTKQYRESWHFQIEPHVAFSDYEFNYNTKCPIPGSQPQSQQTSGANTGQPESRVPEGLEPQPQQTITDPSANETGTR